MTDGNISIIYRHNIGIVNYITEKLWMKTSIKPIPPYNYRTWLAPSILYRYIICHIQQMPKNVQLHRPTCSTKSKSDFSSRSLEACSPFCTNRKASANCMSTCLLLQSPYSACSQYEHKWDMVWTGHFRRPVSRSCRICKVTWCLKGNYLPITWKLMFQAVAGRGGVVLNVVLNTRRIFWR